jgi:AcrR family transcriptional regulator
MAKGAQTRTTILEIAFDLTYRHGFQATSVDEILKKTKVTKGSFFHHFKTKEIMGLAMINEIMYPGMRASMIEPLVNGEDPIQEIYAMMNGLLMLDPVFDVRYGCPAINLVEEMASLSTTFNLALQKLSNEWKIAIVACLNKAQSNGSIRAEHKTGHIAQFIIAGYGGVRNLGKLYGRDCYAIHLEELKQYLKGL